MKKIILIILIVLLVFFIYYIYKDEKIYYLSIGDYLSYGINNANKVDNNYSNNIRDYHENNLKNYVNYSSIDDYRVMDLINDINYNKTVIYGNHEYKLQNLLIKANIMTISIGMNDLLYKTEIDKYDYSDGLLKDIESLLKLIRKYNKDKIYFLSFYNIVDNQDLIDYLNEKLMKICIKNKVVFVDISDLDTYILKGKYPTNEGYNYITDKLLY